MNEEFDAIYEHGILRLEKPLALPEHARVTGTLRHVEGGQRPDRKQQPVSVEEFERMMEQLSLDVPPLPADFSRADIYLG